MVLWIAPSATLVAAIAVVYLTYRANRRLTRRQNLLVRVNLQLEELYGPLMSLWSVNDASWNALMKKHRPGRNFFIDGGQITEQDRTTWVLWMRSVFMPVNRHMYKVIVNKMHLLFEGDVVPQVLLDFCAHVAGYEVVMMQWDEGDLSSLVSLMNYQEKQLGAHIRSAFVALRREQLELLTLTRPAPRDGGGTATIWRRCVGRMALGRQPGSGP